MTTTVFFHAHPDDEGSATAGSMILTARAGHRVVLVYATHGEHGTLPPDLPDGVTLAEHRREETLASAAVTGTARVEWLGYADSGMSGWEQNAHETSFHSADLATRRPRLLESTMNRDLLRAQIAMAAEVGIDPGMDPDAPMDDGNPMGLPEAEIHHQVDVSEVIELKREALACHASQEDVQWMLTMPQEMYAIAFGREHYAEPGAPAGMVQGLPFA